MTTVHNMSKNMKSVLILMFIIGIQLIIYAAFMRPLILTWGASENEVNMPLVGDDLAPYTSSTRAISINATRSDVWKYLVQLGADRGGFYSYTFLERLLGYESVNPDTITPEFQEMKVGRIIPASLDESTNIIKYSWPVVAVKPGESFVLKGWGAFVVKDINSRQTRLIVRTHGWELPSFKSMGGYFIMMPLHYIMERRMLMGIKAKAEAGAGIQLSTNSDILWFSGVFLSGIGIALMVFVGRGIKKILLSVIYGIIWLWPVLILDPHPIYIMVLLFVVAVTMVGFVLKDAGNRRKRRNK